jgi:acetyltransferase-like isoleucine patch superfamily enzyme
MRNRWLKKLPSFFRQYYFTLQGMSIGKNTMLPRIVVTWPHQVAIGANCILEQPIYFKYDGIWKEGPAIIIEDHVFIGAGCEFNITKGVRIGSHSLIASGCKFIDHDHGMEINQLMRLQKGLEQEIQIGKNVWIGCNTVLLKGVIINDGAIVAAGAVVTRSIPSNEIWGGVPAKKIGERK